MRGTRYLRIVVFVAGAASGCGDRTLVESGTSVANRPQTAKSSGQKLGQTPTAFTQAAEDPSLPMRIDGVVGRLTRDADGNPDLYLYELYGQFDPDITKFFNSDESRSLASDGEHYVDLDCGVIHVVGGKYNFYLPIKAEYTALSTNGQQLNAYPMYISADDKCCSVSVKRVTANGPVAESNAVTVRIRGWDWPTNLGSDTYIATEDSSSCPLRTE